MVSIALFSFFLSARELNAINAYYNTSIRIIHLNLSSRFICILHLG